MWADMASRYWFAWPQACRMCGAIIALPQWRGLRPGDFLVCFCSQESSTPTTKLWPFTIICCNLLQVHECAAYNAPVNLMDGTLVIFVRYLTFCGANLLKC